MSDPVPQLPESFDSNKAIHLTLGMASPLWLAFAGAAMAGSAFWWMTRWSRPDNLEAMLELPLAPGPPEAIVEPVAETAEVAAGAAATPVEVVVEATAAVTDALADSDPVVDAPPLDAAPLEDAPLVEAAGDVAAAVADDLTRLVGVGPRLAAALGELGVTSFSQIAGWTAEDVARFDTALSLKGRAVRDAWVAQARRLADV